MKKKFLYLLSVVMLAVICVFGANAYDGDRPYDDTDKFPPEFYKIINGVVYHKNYDSEAKKHYYEIVDYFATEELAKKATEITNLLSEINGIPVTELRFYENNNKKTYPNIKKIILPDSLKVIGEEALWSFGGIKELKIPASVERIERAAFARMSSLEKITLPEKVTYISENLFSGCEKLSKVVIKGDVYAVGADAFSGCSSLKKISLPETVKSIGGGAFAGSGLTSITIPAAVVRNNRFGDADDGPVFKDCKSLAKVVFSDAETKYFRINTDDFRNCTALKKVYLPKSAKNVLISEDAFRNCKKLTKIYNSSNIKEIGANAFRGCKTLTAFTVSSKMTEIGRTAFYGCTKLKKVTVNSKKKAPVIGKKAFGKTAAGIKFVTKNSTAAKSWKSALKKSGLKKMKVCYVKYVNV
ncbi:MAG: leucine-rich repeat protein [Clostridia bacterium]|nr:leucine-rich repeat protein [Clostridia bacterium]